MRSDTKWVVGTGVAVIPSVVGTGVAQPPASIA